MCVSDDEVWCYFNCSFIFVPKCLCCGLVTLQWIVGKTGHNGSEKPGQFSFSLSLSLSLSSSHSLSRSLCNKCASLSLPKIMKTKSCLCILIPPIIPWAKYRARDLSDLLWYSLGIRRTSAGLTHKMMILEAAQRRISSIFFIFLKKEAIGVDEMRSRKRRRV